MIPILRPRAAVLTASVRSMVEPDPIAAVVESEAMNLGVLGIEMLQLSMMMKELSPLVKAKAFLRLAPAALNLRE